eukprot:jgi/Antlo1/1812/20
MNQNDKIREIVVSSSSASKTHLVDGRADTCWVSSHGKSQHIEITFNLFVRCIRLVFQPGFHPRIIHITSGGFAAIHHMQPEESVAVLHIQKHLEHLRIVFLEGYDPYGRICVYTLELF